MSLRQFILLFLSLLLLDASIDPPDIYSLFYEKSGLEDLKYNEIESVSELMLEEYMCITDAIPEQDENDNEESRGKKSCNLFLVYLPKKKIKVPPGAFLLAVPAPDNAPPVLENNVAIDSPPPQAV